MRLQVMLLYLNVETWMGPAGEALADEVRHAQEKGMQVDHDLDLPHTPLHPQRY